jgi:hypothetical protein
MKQNNKSRLLLFRLVYIMTIALCQVSFGQSDSGKVQVTEEDAKNSDYYYRSRYSYIDYNLKVDRSLVKFGFFPFIPGDGYNFNTIFFQASYESKLGKQFSITREINSTYYISENVYYYGLSTQPHSVRTSRTGFGLTCRYYPGMKRRIETKNGANNLNGGYLALNALQLFSFVTYRTFSYDLGTQKDSNLEFLPQFMLAAGFQKRISRLLYFDTQMFYQVNSNNNRSFERRFGVKLLLGIAFNPIDI